MKSAFLKKFFIFGLGFVLCVLYIPQLSADERKPDRKDVIDMVAGDIDTIPTNDLTRVSVTDPDVADISDAETDGISILAKKGGETLLFLWDAHGKRKLIVRVVNEDLGLVKIRVQKVLEDAHITGVTLDENYDVGKVILSGELTKDDRDRLTDIMEPFSDNLMDLVKEEKSEELIEVDMQIVEINTTLDKDLGIAWGPTALNYNETLPTFNGKIGDFFKIGNFSRATSLEATVNALLQEGKARLISKPRLVVESGKQASFQVGGEIPINSTTTNATGSSQTTSTSYTQYGVSMSVTPTIRDNKIEVVLNVNIQDVDNSSLSSPGDIAFITRTASTNLLMDNKQTIALAGLIKYQDSVTLTEVPFVSKIPLLGALFRNRSEPSDANTEMVIIVRPTVLTSKKFENTELVMPTPEERRAWKEIDSKYEHELLPAWPVTNATDQNKTTALPVIKSMPPLPVAKMIVQDPPSPTPKPMVMPVPVVQEAPVPVPVANTIAQIPIPVTPPPAPKPVVIPAPVVQEAPAPVAVANTIAQIPIPVTPPPAPKPVVMPPAPAVQEAPPLPMPIAQEQTAVLPEMAAYARMVHDKIAKVISYPPQGDYISGIVKLKLRIRRDGSLSSVIVVGASGNRILDKYAMQAAKKAAPYDVFTKGMDRNDMVFMIPIVYDKRISGEQAPAEKASGSS